jgi:hypothetical protein
MGQGIRGPESLVKYPTPFLDPELRKAILCLMYTRKVHGKPGRVGTACLNRLSGATKCLDSTALRDRSSFSGMLQQKLSGLLQDFGDYPGSIWVVGLDLAAGDKDSASAFQVWAWTFLEPPCPIPSY